MFNQTGDESNKTMDALVIKKTTDVELLMKVRIDFCVELHPETLDNKKHELETTMREYFLQALHEHRYVGYAGFLQNKLCCGAAVLIYSMPPYSTPNPRKVGHVFNFYVYPQFRKQGIGDQLIRYIIDDTTKECFARLVLNATEAGERVYRKHGFNDPKDRNLILDLNKSLIR